MRHVHRTWDMYTEHETCTLYTEYKTGIYKMSQVHKAGYRYTEHENKRSIGNQKIAFLLLALKAEKDLKAGLWFVC